MKQIREIGTQDIERPYERCLLLGPSSLSDAQLLAVILRTGTKGISAVALSQKILDLRHGREGLSSLGQLTIRELLSISGIGQVKAIQIQCIAELSKRIAVQQARPVLSFSSPESIASYYMEQLRHEEQEHMIMMLLDIKQRLLGEKVVSTGTHQAAPVSVRDLFMIAMDFHAVQIVLVHNHPSGDPSPSLEDKKVTDQVWAAGNLMEIRLLDHIVIGDRCYYSFREHGLIDT